MSNQRTKPAILSRKSTVPKKLVIVPEGQSWFIEVMKAIGYSIDTEGVCYGIAQAAVQSILVEGGVATFDRRLKILNKILPLAKIKRLEESLPLNISKQEKANQMLEKIKSLLKQGGYDPTDICAFFDKVMLFMYPQKFRHLYGSRKQTYFQGAKEVFPLTLSKALENKGVENIEKFLGHYNQSELFSYFEILQSGLQQLTTDNQIAFELSSENHTITIGYDPANHAWLFIDANELPTKFITDNEQMANEVFRAFPKELNGGILFSTKVFTTMRCRKAVVDSLNYIKSDPVWSNMHTITAKKAQSKNSNWFKIAIIDNHTKIIQDLLNYGADANGTCSKGSDLLLNLAVSRPDNVDNIKLLLEHNAEPNRQNSFGELPSCLAVLQGSTEVLKLLLEYKANPNQRDGSGKLPLDYAIQAGHVDIVKLLLPLTQIDEKDSKRLLKAANAQPKIKALLLRNFSQRYSNDQYYFNKDAATFFNSKREELPHTPLPRRKVLPNSRSRESAQKPIPTPRKTRDRGRKPKNPK